MFSGLKYLSLKDFKCSFENSYGADIYKMHLAQKVYKMFVQNTRDNI